MMKVVVVEEVVVVDVVGVVEIVEVAEVLALKLSSKSNRPGGDNGST
jgi:hypothetical protein